jgi:hypothetical protein
LQDRGGRIIIMNYVPRLLLAVTALASAFVGVQAWLSPDKLSAALQLQSTGPVGTAALRADVGGLFWGIAVLVTIAAWRQNRTWVLAALAVVGSAFAGRMVNLIANGPQPGTIPPIMIEAATIAILLWVASRWRERSPA